MPYYLFINSKHSYTVINQAAANHRFYLYVYASASVHYIQLCGGKYLCPSVGCETVAKQEVTM